MVPAPDPEGCPNPLNPCLAKSVAFDHPLPCMSMKRTLIGLALMCSTMAAHADFWHAPPRTVPQLEYEAAAAYTSDSRISLGQARLGTVEAVQTRLVVGWAARPTDNFSYRVAAEYRRNDFDTPPGMPIPKVLGNVGLQLTGNWSLLKDLSFWANARPGIYSDFLDLSWGDVNVPFNAVLAWEANEDLLWMLGVYVDLRSQYSVLGGPGVRWRFADNWTLNLVMPRPQIELQASEDLLLFAGAEWRQVAYRTSRDNGTRTAANPALDGRMLDYREWRLGGGFQYRFNRHFNLGFEGGYVLDRRWVYYQADTQLSDNGAGYVGLSLNGRF